MTILALIQAVEVVWVLTTFEVVNDFEAMMPLAAMMFSVMSTMVKVERMH